MLSSVFLFVLDKENKTKHFFFLLRVCAYMCLCVWGEGMEEKEGLGVKAEPPKRAQTRISVTCSSV